MLTYYSSITPTTSLRHTQTQKRTINKAAKILWILLTLQISIPNWAPQILNWRILIWMNGCIAWYGMMLVWQWCGMDGVERRCGVARCSEVWWSIVHIIVVWFVLVWSGQNVESNSEFRELSNVWFVKVRSDNQCDVGSLVSSAPDRSYHSDICQFEPLAYKLEIHTWPTSSL